MMTAQTQRRARQPNVPPIIAPVLLGVLVLGEDVDWLLLVSVVDTGPGGVVLLGEVVCVEAGLGGVPEAVLVD
jgi:hypothetical protein